MVSDRITVETKAGAGPEAPNARCAAQLLVAASVGIQHACVVRAWVHCGIARFANGREIVATFDPPVAPRQ